MGGVAGWIDREGASVGPGVTDAMSNAIAHRGPDGTGRWDGVSRVGAWRVSLAHRRLSLTESEAAPRAMVAAGGRAVLAFDGHIHNLGELRSELAALGRACSADSEVLLAAFLEWGAGCVHRLRGAFAFAIWDAARERLFLARDHFGTKPLYYWQDGAGAVVFGSEIKALLAHPRVPRMLDRASVAEFLAWGYVPGPHTLFAGIRKLPPASWAMWEDGQLTQASYWAPPDAGDRANRISLHDPVAAFTRLLEAAVHIRMEPDVPFGAFLSGGLGSSAMVALMSRHSYQVNTFSVGFCEGVYGELKHARMVAEHFHTNHHELVVSAEDIIDDLPRLTAMRDAPVGAPADLLRHRLSRLAARSVKLVLSGEGSGEMLGGSARHRAERLSAPYRRVLGPLAAALPDGCRRLKLAMGCMGLSDPRQRLPAWLAALPPAEAGKLLALEVPEREPDPRPFRVARGETALRRALYFDQTSRLPDNLLERGDCMTMAAGIEARMPFTDLDLAQFCSRMPDGERLDKGVLRRAMAPMLPPEILGGSNQGFRVPLGAWFQGMLRNWMGELLLGSDSLTRDWYRVERLARLVNDHAGGRRNHEKALWRLVTLELFQRRYGLR